MEALLACYRILENPHRLQKAVTGGPVKDSLRVAVKTAGKCVCGCDGPGYFPLFTVVATAAPVNEDKTTPNVPLLLQMKDADESSLFHSLVLAIQKYKIEYAAGVEPNDDAVRKRLINHYCKIGWGIVCQNNLDKKPADDEKPPEDEPARAVWTFVQNLRKEYEQWVGTIKPKIIKKKKEKESEPKESEPTTPELLSGKDVPDEFQAVVHAPTPQPARKRSREEDSSSSTFVDLPIDVQDALKALGQHYLVKPEQIHVRLQKKYGAKCEVGRKLQHALQHMSADDLKKALKKVNKIKGDKKKDKKLKTDST